jgi:hypothetical protein
MNMNEHQLPTKCICHKGFRGYSSGVARSSVPNGGQGSSPHSLTAHTLNRYQQGEKNGAY